MPRPKTDSKRINVYLPNRLVNAAKALAQRQGRSFSELTRTALKDYIIKEGNISSSRLLLCAPKIDSDKDAKPSIALSV